MWQVMILARLLAAVLGSNFDQTWACWENFIPEDGPRFVCKWYEREDQTGLYAAVWSDGGPAEWTITVIPPWLPANSTTVSLATSAWTMVQVETGDAPVYLSFGDGWLEVAGPLFDVGQMDPVRIVWLAPGDGVVTFGSDGALFIAPCQLQPGPDPTQPA